ncbi:hypothetical protein ABKV19_014436 [Rosa sericea]
MTRPQHATPKTTASLFLNRYLFDLRPSFQHTATTNVQTDLRADFRHSLRQLQFLRIFWITEESQIGYKIKPLASKSVQESVNQLLMRPISANN